MTDLTLIWKTHPVQGALLVICVAVALVLAICPLVFTERRNNLYTIEDSLIPLSQPEFEISLY